MSEVLSGLSIQLSYSSHSQYAHQGSYSLLGSIESRFPRRSNDNFGQDIPSSTSSMADSQRRGTYDMPTNNVNDEYQRRQSLNQRTSKEQLPPLSSIFQTSHTTTLPVRPPYSEGSPSFAAVSPRTNVQTITSAREGYHHQDPPYEHRNYRQAALPSYPFSTRPDRPEMPHPSLSSGIGISQHFESRYGTDDKSRVLTSSRPRWSPQALSEPSSSDYFPRISQDVSRTDKVYPDPRHQLPPATSTTRYTNSELPYGEKGLVTSPPLTQYQLTSSAANHSEPSSTKDNLGPKIWTGTQFLPRFVKQQEVPGEGLCYFYDDGSHCKTIIDGEVVNAHWGVTKAGKPRKRLAIACITCREKKIKCDPDYPKCVQCEKFGRICKFKNAPRGTSHGSPDTSPTETDDFMEHDSNFALNSQRADAEARRLEKDDDENNHIKRRKKAFNAFTPVKAENEANFGFTDGFRHLSSASESSLYFDSLLNTWYRDPYETNAALANHLMAAYFAHINSGYYRMFPEQRFMRWIHNPCKKKSLDDHMLIYTMLALGSVFSGSMEHKERGREFAKIGRYAADHRSFSLQLIQTRLLLSLYFLATGDKDASWDLCGGAMRAATGIKLNVEIDEIEEMKTEAFPFDLTRHSYSECRRRTFWSLYVMDRFNGLCFGYLCVMNPEDVFLRLPCDIPSFESEIENTNPYFDIATPSITSAKTNNLGSMAYLVIISSIWADVMTNIYRTSYRPEQLPTVSKTAHLNFQNAIAKRLEEWEASLPSYLQYSTVNFGRSMHEGFFGTFLTMHALYHTTQIKLNRFHRSADVSPSQLERNIRKAYTNAKELLAMAHTLAESTIVRHQPLLTKPVEIPVTQTQFSNQFIGDALVGAVDTVSAKGRRSEIPELLKILDEAKNVLSHLEMFWHGARNASRQVEKRVEELEELVGWNEERRRSEGAISGVESNQGIWEMEESIAKTFAKGMDGVYSAPWDIWVSATEGCKTES